MLDINLIRENPALVAEKLARKGYRVDFADFLARDEKRRQLIFATETLKAEKNKTSAEIPKLKKEGQDVQPIFDKMKQISEQISIQAAELSAIEAEQQTFLEALPNLPADDVVAGGKENNAVVSVFGEKPQFDFTPKHHVDLVEGLGMIDYARGAKLGGSGFWVYRKDGALLEWALLNYFMAEHLKDGYEMILPPHILTYQCGYTPASFPNSKTMSSSCAMTKAKAFPILSCPRLKPPWSICIATRSSMKTPCHSNISLTRHAIAKKRAATVRKSVV